jgi:hypothetical protein
MEYEKAEEILDYMRKMNGKPRVDITHYVPPPPLKLRRTMSLLADVVETENHTELIFGKHMWYTTMTLCMGVFTGYLNFMGANYCFLQEMPGMNLFGASSLNLLVGQMIEIPGILVFVTLGMHIRRKSLSIIGLIGASSGIFSFVAIAMVLGQPRAGRIAIALQLSFFVFKFFVTGAVMTLGTFAFEVFPTKARTLGTGVVLGFGRLGGILGPKGYGWSEAYTGSFHVFMLVVVVLNVLSCVLIMSLSGDPKGKTLDDHLPEENYEPDLDEEQFKIYEQKLSQAWSTNLTAVRAIARFRPTPRKSSAPENYGATSDMT